ncbi:hypothetical protein VTO42DRAFT_3734 [Malbranchea cinnamomea]
MITDFIYLLGVPLVVWESKRGVFLDGRAGAFGVIAKPGDEVKLVQNHVFAPRPSFINILTRLYVLRGHPQRPPIAYSWLPDVLHDERKPSMSAFFNLIVSNSATPPQFRSFHLGGG